MITGKFLRKLRIEKGLTMKAVADMARTEESYISLIECDKRRPSAQMAIRLAPAYGIKWTEFFE